MFPFNSDDPDDLLATYLQDHLSAATLGLELAERLTGSNRDDPRFGPVLAQVRDEIRSERDLLKGLIDDLGVSQDPVKVTAAWVAEKAARLKLNGRTTGYSPLSRMIELEGLSTGIAGKCRMWRVFEQQLGRQIGDVDFKELAELADSQRERIDALHVLAGSWLAGTEAADAARTTEPVGA